MSIPYPNLQANFTNLLKNDTCFKAKKAMNFKNYKHHTSVHLKYDQSLNMY